MADDVVSIQGPNDLAMVRAIRAARDTTEARRILSSYLTRAFDNGFKAGASECARRLQELEQRGIEANCLESHTRVMKIAVGHCRLIAGEPEIIRDKKAG